MSTSSSTISSPQQPRPSLFNNQDRLSLAPTPRLFIVTVLSSTLGLALGITHGATLAGLRFRAENAHRLPTSKTGWYLYHKSKNYVAMWGGLREGLRMGARVGVWTGGFMVAEEAVDRGRGRMVEWLGGKRGRRKPATEGQYNEEGVRDFFSSVVAGLSTAGAFSLWNRFPLPTAARTAKLGLMFGLGYGLLQDIMGMMKRRPVSYVDWAKRWRKERTGEYLVKG